MAHGSFGAPAWICASVDPDQNADLADIHGWHPQTRVTVPRHSHRLWGPGPPTMRVPRRDRTDDDLRVVIEPLHHTLQGHRLRGPGRADVEARGGDDQHDNRHRCNGDEVPWRCPSCPPWRAAVCELGMPYLSKIKTPCSTRSSRRRGCRPVRRTRGCARRASAPAAGHARRRATGCSRRPLPARPRGDG